MPYRIGRPEKIKRYRARAEELRTMGSEWKHADTLKMLLSMAADYEEMALILERIEDADGAAITFPI
jgi:hypothetical protein